MAALTSYSTITGLTAAGTNQATALSLSSLYVVQQMGTVAASTGVKLPIATTGAYFILSNVGANPCAVYPQSFGTINALAANAAYVLPVGGTATFISTNGLNWITSAGVTTPTTANVKAVTATTTLTAGDSGSVISINSAAAAVTISLPAPFIGAKYTFIVNGALANAVTIAATGAIVKGWAVATDATAITGFSTTATTNCILGTASVPGDKVEYISTDGTSFRASAGISVHTTLTVS